MAETPDDRPRAPDRAIEPLDDAQLDALARITPADIARAKRAWREDADPQFRELLDAEEER